MFCTFEETLKAYDVGEGDGAMLSEGASESKLTTASARLVRRSLFDESDTPSRAVTKAVTTTKPTPSKSFARRCFHHGRDGSK
mmetsp:Transcript_3982/g.8989  ORF Transcript_3982/g.8989 Transcript_3982/m.8989 type:complete len:83 (-) Transcript_3982:268-516(-)